MDELDPIAKERYVEKLRLVGLGEDDDPYKLWNCGKMVDKMCLWPPVEHGHISTTISSFALVSLPVGAWFCPDCRH